MVNEASPPYGVLKEDVDPLLQGLSTALLQMAVVEQILGLVIPINRQEDRVEGVRGIVLVLLLLLLYW